LELVLKIGLIVIYSVFSAIRIRYQVRARRMRVATVIQESRRYSAMLSALICYEVLTFFLYLLAPQVLQWAALPLFLWLRWTGLGIALLSLAMFVWVHQHLGSNFSMELRIVDGQTLTVSGPYRWMRHPMYTAFIILHVAAFLITANWFIGVTWTGGLIAILALRVKREEAMMLQRFGDEYNRYMRQTGRLLPSLRRPLRDTTRVPGPAQ